MRITWDASGERSFFSGISHGVLYLDNAPGVAWNGFTRVSEVSGSETDREYYIDGEKYLAVPSSSEYSSTIEALSSPSEFAPCTGLLKLFPGVFASNQPRKSFSFSYRTLVDDDLSSQGDDYRIHVVYNARVKTSDFTHQSISSRISIRPYSWTVTAVPVVVNGSRPSAHFVVDSRKVSQALLGEIEDILYGTEITDPHLISAQELMELIEPAVQPVSSDAFVSLSLEKMRVSSVVILPDLLLSDESGSALTDEAGGYLTNE